MDYNNMENVGRHRDCSAHETPSCDSLCQSVGYDSGICLSNYRSTGDPCGAPGPPSRDSDALVSGLRGLQLRQGVESNGSTAARDVVQPGSALEVGPVNGTCQQQQENGGFYEDQLYEQDEEGDTQLHLAIILPDISAAIKMIEVTRISECLDIQNKKYMHTPLHLAVLTDQPPVVRALLISGASLTSRDRSGNTALHLACKQGHSECVRQLTTPLSEMENKYLWDRGIPPRSVKPMQSTDVNLMNYEGESSLQLALFSATGAASEIFDYLVGQCAADINVKDGKCGYTVLHQAVKLKDAGLVQFVLRYPQLSINEPCYGGNTALDIAIGLGCSQLEMVLRMAGGISTESSSSPEMSDDNQVDAFDDLTIGGLLLNS